MTDKNKNKLILGIDPGRDKIGFAFVNFSGDLICSGIFHKRNVNKFINIIKTSEFWELLNYIIEGHIPENNSDLQLIFIGNGTHSHDLIKIIQEFGHGRMMVIDEKNSTIEAKNLYWKIHKPGFLLKFIPEKLRSPGRDVDDLAAWVIALRGIKNFEL